MSSHVHQVSAVRENPDPSVQKIQIHPCKKSRFIRAKNPDPSVQKIKKKKHSHNPNFEFEHCERKPGVKLEYSIVDSKCMEGLEGVKKKHRTIY